MRREGICLTFALSPVATPYVEGLLVGKMRAMIDVELVVGRETSYGGTNDLLGMAIRIANGEKSLDKKISHEEIDG